MVLMKNFIWVNFCFVVLLSGLVYNMVCGKGGVVVLWLLCGLWYKVGVVLGDDFVMEVI